MVVFLDQEFGSYDDPESRDDFRLFRQYVADDDLTSFQPGSGSGVPRFRQHETRLPEGTHECGEEKRVAGGNLVVRREFAKGTRFYEGKHGARCPREVAVKYFTKAHDKVAENEMTLLIKLDNHPNVIRYLGSEEDKEYIYILLERCDCNLYDLVLKNRYSVLWGPNGYPSAVFLELMQGIAAGLEHLHSNSIAHGNLTPQNVLIVDDAEGKVLSLCPKLSDLSNSRSVVGDIASLESNATVSGSLGRQVPKQIRQGPQQIGHEHQTLARDLERLGFVIFFCMTRGKQNEVNLSSLQHIPEAVDLLTRLLDSNPELRPVASEVLRHLLFWNSEKRLSFLRKVSDFLEAKKLRADCINALEGKGPLIFQGMWGRKMHPGLISHCNKYRTYNWWSVQDLLRIIRNNYHYWQFPRHLKILLGTFPDGVDDYYRRRFPQFVDGGIQSYVSLLQA